MASDTKNNLINALAYNKNLLQLIPQAILHEVAANFYDEHGEEIINNFEGEARNRMLLTLLKEAIDQTLALEE